MCSTRKTKSEIVASVKMYIEKSEKYIVFVEDCHLQMTAFPIIKLRLFTWNVLTQARKEWECEEAFKYTLLPSI